MLKTTICRIPRLTPPGVVRYLSRKVTLEDVIAHNNYGTIPRIKSVLSFYQDDDFRKKMQKPIAPLRNWGVNNPSAYADIKHPVLQKYKFDTFEFLEGAAQAYDKIMETAFSDDFVSYRYGNTDKIPPSAQYLKYILDPLPHQYVVEFVDFMHHRKRPFVLCGQEVNAVTIRSVKPLFCLSDGELLSTESYRDESKSLPDTDLIAEVSVFYELSLFYVEKFQRPHSPVHSVDDPLVCDCSGHIQFRGVLSSDNLEWKVQEFVLYPSDLHVFYE